MAVIKDSCVVGLVPRIVSPIVFFFLGKDGSIGFSEVTATMVNRTAGFGLKIPCVYRFYGHQAYIERLKNLLLKQRTLLTTLSSCSLFCLYYIQWPFNV